MDRAVLTITAFAYPAAYACCLALETVLSNKAYAQAANAMVPTTTVARKNWDERENSILQDDLPTEADAIG